MAFKFSIFPSGKFFISRPKSPGFLSGRESIVAISGSESKFDATVKYMYMYCFISSFSSIRYFIQATLATFASTRKSSERLR